MAEKMFGHSTCGIYGYSHLTGGFAGGQSEYARVPFADVGTLKIPEGLDDEKVLFLSDIFPTGYMGAEMCNIQPGDTVAVWGCGPVGQFAMASAYLLGAERVIGIDRFPERLRMAREGAKADTINYEEANVFETLMEMTGGRGPDACIDAVGLEAHGAGAHSFEYIYDRTKQALMRGHHGLPQRRDGLGHRRLRRLDRQVPPRLVYAAQPDDENRPVPRPALLEEAARPHPGRQDRPVVRHHAPPEARRRGARLRHLQQQGGRLHQGRPEALSGHLSVADRI
jgi:hypothetical protein